MANSCIPQRGGGGFAVQDGFPSSARRTYPNLRSFEQEPPEPEICWKDNRFGSYAQLIASQEFRFGDRGDCRV
jgi:hypothetical protein